MIVAVIDTHALIWCITADQRLSQPARDTISQAVTSKQHIVLSTMSLIEIIYLIEKKRLPDDLLERLLIEMDTPGTIFTMIPIERPIIMTM